MKQWTLDAYNKLCEEYATSATWRAISERVGHSERACRHKIKRGVGKTDRGISKIKKWTAKEIESLIWCCKSFKDKRIDWNIVAKAIDRTVPACKSKWQSINLL